LLKRSTVAKGVVFATECLLLKSSNTKLPGSELVCQLTQSDGHDAPELVDSLFQAAQQWLRMSG
jgi:hypothetical protein